MNAIFSQSKYVVKRQGLAIGGKYKVFGPDGKESLLYSEEKSKWFPPSRTIHVYSDEKRKNEVLTLKDRPNDSSENLDVIDPENSQKIGSLVMGAETVSEIFKDAWFILDAEEKQIGKIFDKSLANSLVRDMVGHGIPQHMQINIGEIEVGGIHQKLKALGYELELDLSQDVSNLLDHRMAVAISLLIAYEQGKETD